MIVEKDKLKNEIAIALLNLEESREDWGRKFDHMIPPDMVRLKFKFVVFLECHFMV